MEIVKFIANYSGWILILAVSWSVVVELIKRLKVRTNPGDLDERTIRRNVTRALMFSLSYTSFLLIVVNIIIASSAGATYFETTETNKILNRPYIAADVSKLDDFKLGRIKSSLDNLSEQLIEKRLEFSIKNLGQSPAAFLVDLSGLEEVGVKDIIPLENSKGVIFPGESKEVRYLLEIHSSFPVSDREKGEKEQYLRKVKEVISGEREYLSRITVFYDYLDEKGKGKFQTIVDQKSPKTSFQKNETGRVDGYSYVWLTSFDSK